MRLTKHYAIALFEALHYQQTDNQLKEDLTDSFLLILDQLESIADFPAEIWQYYATAALQFNHQEEMRQLLLEDFDDFLNPQLIDFLVILAEDQMIQQLPQIVEEYKDILTTEDKLIIATVISAAPLSATFKSILEKRLSQQYSMTIRFEYKVDLKLIGGLRLLVNGAIIDTSYQSRIKQITNEG